MLNPGESISLTDPNGNFPLTTFNPTYTSAQDYINDITTVLNGFTGYNVTQINPKQAETGNRPG